MAPREGGITEQLGVEGMVQGSPWGREEAWKARGDEGEATVVVRRLQRWSTADLDAAAAPRPPPAPIFHADDDGGVWFPFPAPVWLEVV